MKLNHINLGVTDVPVTVALELGQGCIPAAVG